MRPPFWVPGALFLDAFAPLCSDVIRLLFASRAGVLRAALIPLCFLGGRIVSSKPFAPLNFRINSRNLSGKNASVARFLTCLIVSTCSDLKQDPRQQR